MPKTRKRNGFATTNKEQQQGEGETKNKGEKQTKKKNSRIHYFDPYESIIIIGAIAQQGERMLAFSYPSHFFATAKEQTSTHTFFCFYPRPTKIATSRCDDKPTPLPIVSLFSPVRMHLAFQTSLVVNARLLDVRLTTHTRRTGFHTCSSSHLVRHILSSTCVPAPLADISSCVRVRRGVNNDVNCGEKRRPLCTNVNVYTHSLGRIGPVAGRGVTRDGDSEKKTKKNKT